MHKLHLYSIAKNLKYIQLVWQFWRQLLLKMYQQQFLILQQWILEKMKSIDFLIKWETNILNLSMLSFLTAFKKENLKELPSMIFRKSFSNLMLQTKNLEVLHLLMLSIRMRNNLLKIIKLTIIMIESKNIIGNRNLKKKLLQELKLKQMLKISKQHNNKH